MNPIKKYVKVYFTTFSWISFISLHALEFFFLSFSTISSQDLTVEIFRSNLESKGLHRSIFRTSNYFNFILQVPWKLKCFDPSVDVGKKSSV